MSDLKPSISASDLLMYKVAVLASQGLKQHQIVERLESTQPTISRKMKQAQEQNLLEMRAPLWQGPTKIYREVGRLLHPVDELLDKLQGESKQARRRPTHRPGR